MGGQGPLQCGMDLGLTAPSWPALKLSHTVSTVLSIPHYSSSNQSISTEESDAGSAFESKPPFIYTLFTGHFQIYIYIYIYIYILIY